MMKRIIISILFTLIVLIANSATITRYIKTTATGTKDGTSWENASSDIQAMIDVVYANADKGEVRIAAGTYTITKTLNLPDGVNLTGGFPANASTLNTIRDLKNNITILDGNNAVRILTGPTIDTTSSTVTTINGLVFQRGFSGYGSAIWMSLGTVLQNCIIRNNNSTAAYGAAVYMKPNTLVVGATTVAGALINCLIINNSSTSSTGGAGGVFIEPGTYFTIVNCVVANNLCNDVAGSGGVNYSAPSAGLWNNIFYNNKGANADVKFNNINAGKSATKGNNNNWYDNDVLPIIVFNVNGVPTVASYNNKCRTDFSSPAFVLPTTFIGYDNTKMATIASSDWSLKATSGCIDVGVASNIGNPYSSIDLKTARQYVCTDIIGVVRIDKTAPDLGCYEYRSPITSAQLSDIDIVYQRLKAETLSQIPKDLDIAKFIATPLWNDVLGTWTDIDFTKVAPVSSNISEHLSRISQLSIAFSSPTGTYFHSAVLMNIINKAIAFYLLNNSMISKNSGSYAYSVVDPKTITSVISIVGDAMDQTLKGNFVDYINNMIILGGYYTGTNLGWVSEWRIRQGCENKDYELIKKTIENVSSLLDMTKSGQTDGLKVDYAYFQHYMINNGEYSSRIPGLVMKFPGFVKATSFETLFPTKVLGDYVLEGQYWFSFRKYGDISVRSRRLGIGCLEVPICYNSLFDQLKIIDPTRATQYDEYYKEQVNNGPFTKAGNKHFFTSDIMVHRGTADYMSVKIPSKRTMLAEIQNYENLKGSNLGFGFTQILTTSHEYTNIGVVWDWSRLPGTTTPLGSIYMDPMAVSGQTWRVSGSNSFGGGVSDGKNGVMAFTSTDNGVTVTKSYFMMGKAMICLGSQISSTYNGNTVTSVNQTLSSGPITQNDNNNVSTFTGTLSTFNNTLQWVHQNNVGYYFPTQTAKIVVKNDNQTGSWYDISHAYADSIVTYKVFSIWFDHGIKPTVANPASYQYIVVPSVSATAFASWVATNPYTVLSNTKDIQCVKDTILSIYGIAFYTPNIMNMGNGIMVKTDKPSLVMMEKNATGWKVTVSDPLHDSTNTTVTITINNQAIVFNLPQGDYLGSSTSKQVDLCTTNGLTATITPASATTICEGGSVVLKANTAIGFTYSWMNGSTTVGALENFTAKNAGSYTVEITNASGCKAKSIPSIITINPLPTITTYVRINTLAWQNVNNITAIEGDNVSFGPQPSIATGWTWTGPNNFTSTLRNPIVSTVSQLQNGTYTAIYTDAAGCSSSQKIVLTVLKKQSIALKVGWNLISINLYQQDSSIAKVFAGLDVQEIKTADGFWIKGQNPAFNSLQTINAGKGYLVRMNVAGVLNISGIQSVETLQIKPLPKVWNLIGCPYQTTTSFTTIFNALNTTIIKDFDGFWTPNGTTNSLQSLVPGKGYYIKVK